MSNESRTSSPIDRSPPTHADDLPSELLCDIFLEVARINRLDDPTSSISTIHVSQVCRRWRDAALSRGGLWSLLFIRFDGNVYTSKEQFARYREATINIFDLWLRRTKESPLSFTLIYENISVRDRASNLAAEHMASAMLSQQHRWRKVHFQWVFLPSPEFGGVVATNMPLLLSLDLRWFGHPERESEVRPGVIDISHSRSLQKLSLLGRHTLETGRAPIDTLTETSTLAYLNNDLNLWIRTYWKFLQTAVNLKHFVLLLGDRNIDVPEDLPDLNLPNLLIFHELWPSRILNKLTATSLQALESGPRNTWYVNGGALLRFIQRSMPPLTHLSLHGIDDDEDDLVPVLRLLPALRRFDISWFYASSARLFQELAYKSTNVSKESGEGHPLCPELRVICIARVGYLEDNVMFIDALKDMIISRWIHMKSFKKITVDSTQYELPDSPLTEGHPDYDYLRGYMKYGGEILIEDEDPPSNPFDVPLP